MNKLCKQYITDAKKFFPVVGRKERDYLRKVSVDIEDFIEAENITTKAELIEKYRQPYELANNYYASFFDTDLINKRIRISKYIKALISVIIIILLLGFTLYASIIIANQQMAARQEMVGYEDSFAVMSDENIKDHSVNKSDNYDSLAKLDGQEIVEEEEIIE